MKNFTLKQVVFAVLALALAVGVAIVVIDSTRQTKPGNNKVERLIPVLTGPKDVVARIGSVDVTLKEYVDMMTKAKISYMTEFGKDLEDPVNIDAARSIRQDVLESLLEFSVYRNYALEKGIMLSDAEIAEAVNDEIDSELAAAGSRDKLEKQLRDSGRGGIEKLRETLKSEPEFLSHLLKGKVKEHIQKDVKISEKDAEEFYESKLVGISRIVLYYDKSIDPPELEKEGWETVRKIRDLIGTKGTFDEVAKQFSEEYETAANGGKVSDLFIKGSLPAEIDDVVWKMKAGDVSQPILTNEGFVIVRLDLETYVWQYYFPDTATKQKTPFKLIKNKVADQLYTIKVIEAENKWYNDYRASLKTEIFIKFESEEVKNPESSP